MVPFNYKSGCGIHECILRHLKEELALAIDKWLQVMSNTMLFKQLDHYTTKNLKVKAILIENNIVCIAMCPLVTYYN